MSAAHDLALLGYAVTTWCGLLGPHASATPSRDTAPAEPAWRRGARLDSWMERIQPQLWWQAMADCGIDTEAVIHRPVPLDARLPWDHVNVKKGRTYLEKEQNRAVLQLAAMADAR